MVVKNPNVVVTGRCLERSEGFFIAAFQGFHLDTPFVWILGYVPLQMENVEDCRPELLAPFMCLSFP